MPIQATCPGCRNTLKVADTARGKQVRCVKCKTIFIAGDTSGTNGNKSSANPATPTSKPAAKSKAVTPNARPKSAPVVLELADDDQPVEKKKKSMLPAVLLGCGALFLLCGGGGSLGCYFIYTKIIKIKNEAVTSINQFQAEIDKAAAEQKRKQEENQQRIQNQHKQNKPEPNPPAGRNQPTGKNPNDVQDPPVQPPQTAVIQSVALSIPLEAKPQDVFNVLWTGTDRKQAVVLVKVDKMLRLDQLDLTNGRKLGNMDMPFEAATYVRDFSPDGNYYVCNHAGTPFSIWALPNPKPIVDKWLPPPVQNESTGAANSVVAAYLLNGPRVLTVNGAGQVAVWSMPTATGEKPTKQMAYVPPPSVAKYPLGLAPERTALSPDRMRLAVFNGSDGFFLLNTATLQLEGSVNSSEDAQPEKAAISNTIGPVFSPDSKHLAVRFHTPVARGSRGGSPQLVRWDVQTRQRTARFADSSKGAASRIGWWGNDFLWVARNKGSSSLISWDKQKVVLRALSRTAKVYVGNADGKCWLLGTSPDGNAVLKGIDLPAAALQQAAQPLKLTGDGIVR
ncbi:MAG TPA: hypothetical protein VMG10_09775 [Gemmataceae bacterium]|nr:hypothetical protein [Gemmataceae bacterium]